MNSKLRTILQDVKQGKGFSEKYPQVPVDDQIIEAEKAIRKAVAEDMLELIDAEIEASKKNLAYAEENNHSDRIRANWEGCIEGEMFCRQKIKQWAALKETTNE